MAIDSDTATSNSPPKQLSETLDSPISSPNKRLKTMPSPTFIKGKSKIEQDEEIPVVPSSELNRCGICLSEEGSSIRGCVDSCDHYFCFVCIMEWAKVESKCPLCKRRFSSIRRPPKDGVFPSERIVKVPVRDQVYHYFGNATVGPPDPYTDVKCSVCLSTADECLLLLCDLCDSASHTFCVGLGATVPEGDWYCQDCMLSRTEHAKIELDNDSDTQPILKIIKEEPSAEAHSLREVGTNTGGTTIGQGARAHSARHAAEFGARTLRRCQNVHRRIQLLRNNWIAFQNGSLSFSSPVIDNHGISDKVKNDSSLISSRSVQTLGTSCSSQQLRVQNKSSGKQSHDRGTHNMDKAWKMMDVAKLMERDCRKTISHSKSKTPSERLNVPMASGGMCSVLPRWSQNHFETSDHRFIRSKKHYLNHTLERDINRNRSQTFGNHRVILNGMNRQANSCGTFPVSHLSECSEFSSSGLARTSAQVNLSHRTGRKLPEEILLEVSSDLHNERDDPTCMNFSDKAKSEDSDISHIKTQLYTPSFCKMETSCVKDSAGKSCIDGKIKRDTDAKSEIQSLVKLNLKLLSGGKKLEVDAFKEVARLATHSILAACGLERAKPGIHSFPCSVCCHPDEVRQHKRSTLMPTSCRECFYAFVKDVVNTILSEKTSSELPCR